MPIRPQAAGRPRPAGRGALAVLLYGGGRLFAAAATGCIPAGIAFEKHDLIRALGEANAADRPGYPR